MDIPAYISSGILESYLLGLTTPDETKEVEAYAAQFPAIRIELGKIEDAINEHPAVAESAIVGFPHDIKGNALYGFVILKESGETRDKTNLAKEINQHISDHIGPIAKLDKIQFVSGLPKTRSGKIMRRILRKIAEGDFSNFGDITTLLNPEIVDEIKNGKL